MIHTYPSNQYKLDFQKWKPAKWSTIEQGDVVGLSFRDGTWLLEPWTTTPSTARCSGCGSPTRESVAAFSPPM